MRGLEGPVDVYRDPLGVPHLRARSVHDAFFAQGFVHAQDRLWQMEFDRRRSSGRLAELLGPSRLVMDIFCRRMGLDAAARADHDAFDDETRSILQAYAAGVNAFLDSTEELPVEFGLLGITPGPWEPWHCSAVLKVRHVLMGTFDIKLWRAQLADVLGLDRARSLGTPHGRPDALICGGSSPADIPWTELVEGSNNWAVHGSRTASGLPLVAGDPHRALEVPNVYAQLHMACPDFDAIGLSIPGTPGLFHFGHNASAAWCITHAMADTQDLYVERFDDAGRYEFRGEWLQAERRIETITVRGGAPVSIDVVTTHHGPIVLGDDIALRWTATDRPATSLRSVLPMLRAGSVDELDDAMRWWVDPCNSFVMADVHGTIGYVYRGRVPVRSAANRFTPVPGSTGEHEWEGDVPFEDLPRLRNTDHIVTANNRVTGSGAYLGTDYAAPNRAQRILERLGALDKATAADMAAIHADRISLDGRYVASRVEHPVLDGWDGDMDPDAAAPCLYAALRDELAGLLTERLSGLVDTRHPDEPYPSPARARLRSAAVRLLAAEDPVVADWDAALTEAAGRAEERLRAELGPPQDWAWRRLHTTGIRHPVSRELDPPSFGCGGDRDTVWASGAETGLGIEHASVARYVFDLGDWERSGWIVPLGASGDPSSPHYADQAADWAAVRLRPMPYDWTRIEQGAEAHRRLEPS